MLGGIIDEENFFITWLTWWFGDTAGVMVVAPLFIIAKDHIPCKIKHKSFGKALILFGLLIFCQSIVFGDLIPSTPHYPLAFVSLPFLMWITFRFDRLGAILGVTIVSVTSIVGTAQGLGPFVFNNNLNDSLLILQLFMGLITVTFLAMAAVNHERNQAVRAKTEAESRYADLYENAPDMFASVETDTGKVIQCNQTIADRLGYSKEEIIGAPITQFYPADDLGAVKKIFNQFVETGVVNDAELWFQRKNGTKIAVSLNVSAVRDEQGKILYCRSIWRNITARKKMEAALIENEELLRSIVNNTSAVIYLKDLQGRYILINRQYENLFKLKNEYVKGKTDLNIFPRKIAEKFMANDKKVLEMGTIMECEEVAPHEDGLHTYISVKFPVRRINGEVLGVGGISTDITDRKRVEDELLLQRNLLKGLVDERTKDLLMAKDKAEKANQAKTEFLSRISHELRTPLNAILGFTQLLDMNREGNLSQMDKENIQRVLNSGEHLLELVNDVLDLSQIEKGGVELKNEIISVKHVVDELVVSLFPLAEKKEITIENKISEVENLWVYADKTRFNQIMLNLLSNAIKYNREKGSVFIYGKNDDPLMVEISVRDTGPGIPKDKQIFIFRPFHRLTDDPSVEGIGMGLAITKNLVEFMKGSISVQSEVGEGSNFFIKLPKQNHFL